LHPILIPSNFQLTHVLVVYPTAKVEPTETGLALRRSKRGPHWMGTEAVRRP
jgi:hypothetical protein